jgi:hypothetical protein
MKRPGVAAHGRLLLFALALSLSSEGATAIRNLLGLVFRSSSKNGLWYLIGAVLPVAAVAFAIIVARNLHSGAAFIPLAPLTLGLQVFTGAMGWDGEAFYCLTSNAGLVLGS